MKPIEDPKMNTGGDKGTLNRIVIEMSDNWPIDLDSAISKATDKDVIIVDSEAKRIGALKSAEKRGKKINIEVERPTGSI